MMGFLTGFLLPCLYAVLACVAFCFILNQRGLLLVVSSLGGGVGWAFRVYLPKSIYISF